MADSPNSFELELAKHESIRNIGAALREKAVIGHSRSSLGQKSKGNDPQLKSNLEPQMKKKGREVPHSQ